MRLAKMIDVSWEVRVSGYLTNKEILSAYSEMWVNEVGSKFAIIFIKEF